MNTFLADMSGNYSNWKAYANENIYSTNDDTYAYINSKGVIKPYDSVTDYNATNSKRGCGSAKINVSTRLSNLSLPIGKDMYSEQSCGYENTYVSYDFPARKKDVSGAWLTSDRAKGTVPYPSLLSDMTLVGKAGYIDFDTTYHSISPQFKDTYGSSMSSYITGATSKIASCAASAITMKYGDKITLLQGNTYLKRNSSDRLVSDDSSPTELYILPSTNLQALGNDVKYGDSVYLSVTESMTTCGTNCRIGGVTYANIFRFGESADKNKFTIHSANSVDKTGIVALSTGTSIKYREPVYIDATVYMNRMVDGDILDNHSNGLKSKTDNGNTAYLTFENGKIKVKVNNGASTTINPDTETIVGGAMTFKDGKIKFINAQGDFIRDSVYPTTPVTFSGSTPYYLCLASSGLVVVVDNNNVIQWRSDTSLARDSVYSGYLLYGSLANDQLVFNTTSSSESSSVFKFSKIAYGNTNQCDVDALKKLCVDASGCTGFIHSTTDNTWTKMMSDYKSSDYAISANDTNVYLRDMVPGMKDTSCPTSDTFTFLSAYELKGYPTGKDISNNGSRQCNIINSDFKMSEVEKDAENTKQHVYDFDKDDIQIKINGLEKYRKRLQEDKDDYDGMYTLFKSKDNDKTGTQKLKDSNVTLSQEKTLALIWGIVSVSMLMILLFRPRINST